MSVSLSIKCCASYTAGYILINDSSLRCFLAISKLQSLAQVGTWNYRSRHVDISFTHWPKSREPHLSGDGMFTVWLFLAWTEFLLPSTTIQNCSRAGIVFVTRQHWLSKQLCQRFRGNCRHFSVSRKRFIQIPVIFFFLSFFF